MNPQAEPTFDAAAVRQWLDVLYAHTPGLIHVASTGNWTGRAFTDRDQVVDYMTDLDQQQPEGIYLRATTLTAPLPPGARGGAADSCALPGLWADLDIAGPGHKTAEQLPPDEAAARAIITASGLPEPTTWVHSGGGLYPWWILNDAANITNDSRDYLSRLSARWQTVIGRAATTLGWHYGTGVGDLSRVLRAPGTLNRKAGLIRACRVIDAHTARYTIDQLDAGLDAALRRHPDPAPRATPARRLEVVRAPGEITPNDDFERRVPWDDPLLLGDWKVVKGHPGAYCEWVRPDKDTAGISATTGHDPGRDRLKVFTDATAFEQGAVYTKPGAYAVLHHGGDHKAAARELARLGFGTPRVELAPPAPPAAWPTGPAPVDGTAARALAQPAAEYTGGTLASPNQPLAVARQLAARMHAPRAWWRGDFYQWCGTCWNVVETSAIEHWIYQQTEHASYVAVTKDGVEDRPWAPTKKRVSDLLHALGVGALQRFGEPDQVVATTNGVLDVATRTLLPHHPDRFNLFSLPFAYDPDAQAPAWQAFLDSVLPDDQQAHDFLGEWFGYVLSGRTDQQKMAALIGARRSGKGTIARVLAAMLGKENVAGLDLNHLPGTFGLENLIGRALAISGDVRWHSRNIGDAVPLLLRIIGEDVMDVARKNRTTWNGLLPTRIMMMSNDTPTFSDRSGALGGRMIYVKFDQSFYGREDTGLTDKLLDELPGILNWALEGLDRLNGRGRFTEPDSGQIEAEAVRRLSDPIGTFIEDWCDVGPDREITLDSLFTRYKNWCESEGRTKDTTTKTIFSRDLRSKIPKLVVKRERVGGKQIQVLYGIGADGIEVSRHVAF